MECRATARHDWMERAAIGGSLLCLVHCIALPSAIALLPALGNAALPHDAHVWLLAFVVPATGGALIAGYRGHRDPRPLVVGVAGLCLLAVAALLLLETAWETPLTVIGSLAIVAAHGGNWMLRHAGPTRTDCPCDAGGEPR